MRYHIKIIKLENNEKYDEQIKEWKERERYHMPNQFSEYPRIEIETPALETILTQEEFDKIKKSVLEIM